MALTAYSSEPRFLKHVWVSGSCAPGSRTSSRLATETWWRGCQQSRRNRGLL